MAIMRIIMTGTVGLDKAEYLEKVRALARQRHRDVHLCHVGQMMYAEAPDVGSGRILDLPLSRLHSLRRSVFKDVLQLAETHESIIVNTHATFRWKHGLFPAFDFDQLAEFDADMYVCLLDNIDAVHTRLEQDHLVDHSLKDLLVWREEETLATELMMAGCSLVERESPAKFYLQASGRNSATAQMVYRLVFEPETPKAYISFPMTHVVDMPEILAEIDEFRHSLAEHLIVFDPGDLEEYPLYLKALRASEQGQRVLNYEVLDQMVRFDVAEVLQAGSDFHAQIYARDFKLIDQADMIISYIPEMPGGKPGLSSGVERELQHAHEATREVYIVWKPRVTPSPFVVETATKIFPNVSALLNYFEKKEYIQPLEARETLF